MTKILFNRFSNILLFWCVAWCSFSTFLLWKWIFYFLSLQHIFFSFPTNSRLSNSNLKTNIWSLVDQGTPTHCTEPLILICDKNGVGQGAVSGPPLIFPKALGFLNNFCLPKWNKHTEIIVLYFIRRQLQKITFE